MSGQSTRWQWANAQLCLPIDDRPDRAGEAARRWFRSCFERLTGDLGAQVRNASPATLEWTSREPFAICAGVGTSVPGDRWMTTYGPANWQLLMDRLGHLPQTASLEASKNTSLGRRGDPSFAIGMIREPDATGNWLMLDTSIDVELANDPSGQNIILQVIREVAEHGNPTSGVVFSPEAPMQTPLETALNIWPSDSVPRSRNVLRDYGWLTIMAEELGDRLGGLAAFRDSGAFVDVAHLTGGGYWLLATERREDYQLEQAERLFEIFAPVLPPGRPRPHEGSPNVIVERDPADATGGI